MENRRKNYFIKKDFQAKFILKFCILVILTALISAGIIYLFSERSVTTVFEKSRLTIKPSTEFIMPGLIISSLISIVFVSIATIAIVLFISHKIAGPLYKLENSIEKIGDGDVSFDIYFRKHDQAKALSDTFNKSRKRLNGIISDVRKDFKDLTAALEEARKISEQGSADLKDVKKSIDSLGTLSGEIGQKLDRFKL